MTLNKTAETKLVTFLIVAALIVAGAYLFVPSVQTKIDGLFASNNAAPVYTGGGEVLTDTKDCPTDGTTTYTINVQDALATTATSVYPEYYLFNGNQLIKEGTLSSTASTVSVSCGKDYKALLINTTAGNGNGLYAKIIDLKARIAQQTVNEEMVVVGQAKILNIMNPADIGRLPNMSLGAGATKNFEIQFNANVTARGFNKPIIMCQANVTEIQSIALSSFNDGSKPTAVTTLPKRVSASSGFQYYAWSYDKLLDPTQSAIVAGGSVTSTSTGPASTSSMACKLIDQQTWKTSGYKTATSIESGFMTGPENTETNADVGAGDSDVAYLYFVNSNGV